MTERVSVQALAAGRLDALTGVRFVAAAHVFVFHYLSTLKRDGLLASMLGGEWLLARWVEGLWRTGYVAISLFFVLSGFILTYTDFDAHGQRRATVMEFWGARLARVYPAYLFGLFFCMAMLAVLRLAFPEQALATTSVNHKLAAIRPEGPLETLLHAGMLQAWMPLHTGFWNVPGWTIGTEAFFYFVFPFVAPVLFKRPARVERVPGPGVHLGEARRRQDRTPATPSSGIAAKRGPGKS